MATWSRYQGRIAIDKDRMASEALRVLGGAYHASMRVEALEKLRGIAMFVGKQKEPRWLWHASEHGTGAGLASGFGRRTDEVFVWLQALLEPSGITRSHTDHWGAEARHRARGCQVKCVTFFTPARAPRTESQTD